MTQQSFALVLDKPSKRNLQTSVIQSNADSMVESINTKSRQVRGWRLVSPSASELWEQHTTTTGDAQYLYTMSLTLRFDSADREPPHSELQSILRDLASRASQPMFGRWNLASVDGTAWQMPAPGEQSGDTSEIGYSPVNIPEDWSENFTHLYGLDQHIGRILRALEAGVDSSWVNRFHCALVGPPGCGKSDTARSIKKALGDEAVMEFDATAMTSAGAIKELTEREILPRILIVEEIEKADEKALSFLLGVCDLRGEIRKTTARANIQRDTKLFVIATVNDMDLFRTLQKGALASRFANPIFYKRPTREMREMILRREIAKVKGDNAWINPCLDYCEKHEIDDPRQITALCLCGREMWLDNSYADMLNATAEPGDIVAGDVPGK